MNLEIVTIPPVLPPPIKTFVLTLTEQEAQLLRTRLGLDSGKQVHDLMTKNGYGEKQAREVHDLTYSIFDALDSAEVKNILKEK